jgi:hypothetical protein
MNLTSQSQLRVTIFCLWLLFWVISTVLLFLAPTVRNTGPVPLIDRSEIPSAILSVSGVWLPALSCLAAFWFPAEERKKSKHVSVPKDKVFAAVTLTSVYLVFVLVLIVWSVYLIKYNDPSLTLSEGTSLLEQIDKSVKLSLVISPVALTPINWLTGK